MCLSASGYDKLLAATLYNNMSYCLWAVIKSTVNSLQVCTQAQQCLGGRCQGYGVCDRL